MSNRSYLSTSIGQLLHRVAGSDNEDPGLMGDEMTGDGGAQADSDDSSACSEGENDETKSPPPPTTTTRSDSVPATTVTSTGEFSSPSNSSSTSSLSSLVVQGRAEGINTLKTTQQHATMVKKNPVNRARHYRKSHLRIMYEWLKGLYCIQARGNINICSKSTGSMQTLISNQSFGNHLQRVS